MAKVSQEQTKEDERKVIEFIRTHAKDNIETIAKHCKFSPQKVWRIISKLEKEKKIWGYSAVVDDEYFGLIYWGNVSRSCIPCT